jgi:Domain of unknown function (DUF4062)
MAKPRVFVSSTYYDLKHLRSSLENFIEGLGYEPILSEKDDIAFIPDMTLDESCYREARTADIFVLIIGGRYGSEVSKSKRRDVKHDVFAKYESITKEEYNTAQSRNIPTYVLLESNVDAEYQTYLKNKENTSVEYAHVDSTNIFMFIEEIRDKLKNNPIKLFSKYSEIEEYLKEQWAGFFHELINRMSLYQRQVEYDLKLSELIETNKTLKVYLEQVFRNVAKGSTPEKVIKQEDERLKKIQLINSTVQDDGYLGHLVRAHGLKRERIFEALISAASYKEFWLIINNGETEEAPRCALNGINEVNSIRKSVGKSVFDKSETADLKIRPLRPLRTATGLRFRKKPLP